MITLTTEKKLFCVANLWNSVIKINNSDSLLHAAQHCQYRNCHSIFIVDDETQAT